MHKTHTKRLALRRIRSVGGFSMVELLIALVLGLIMMGAFGTVYLSSKSASRRLEQISDMQNSVRTAFEYFSNDAHGVGLTGCHQARETGFVANAATGLADEFSVGIQGFDAAATPTYPWTQSTASSTWTGNVAGTYRAFDPALLGASVELATGSDVVILRGPATRPLRLTGNAAAGGTFTVEGANLQGVCSDRTTARRSGLCASGYALVASCTDAQVVRMQGLSGNSGSPITVTPSPGLATTYLAATTEVFPLQTVVYYVRAGSRAGSMSLYRRVFDGDDAVTAADGSNPDEQELIEDVENLQVTYGVDTDNNPDGTRNFNIESYVRADEVTDWSRVIAVRMSLLLRSRDPLRDPDAVVADSASVNNVAITLPTTGDKFDRRVFTTTVALRNRIANN